jgi:cysteinyl-tRNA synthetase
LAASLPARYGPAIAATPVPALSTGGQTMVTISARPMRQQVACRALPPSILALAVLALGVLAILSTGSTAFAADPVVRGKAVRTWGYQLQNSDPAAIARSPYDLVVIDYSRDATDARAFKPADLEAMKRKPDGSRRIVLAYVSIGEAESYRYYWQERGWNDPRNRLPLVDEENKEWRNNFAVRFWENEWQDLMLMDDDSYMNRVMRAGFDGVYLDRVDVADQYEGKTPQGTVASDLMIQFVRKISVVMKQRQKDFVIFPQNAQGLLEDVTYRAAIDGIGIEDLLHQETPVAGTGAAEDGPRNTPAAIKESVDLLKPLVAASKPVVVVEYLKEKAAIDRASTELTGYGFIPYFGPRDLARLALP